MCTLSFFIVLILTILGESKASSNIVNNHGSIKNPKSCSSSIPKIGCVIDYKSRIGKEVKIAMEMAVKDHNIFNPSSENCAKLNLSFRNSQGNPALATASVRNLIRKLRVEAIVGALSYQEIPDDITKRKLPFISLSSPAIPTKPFLFQIANDVVFQSRAIAAIVKYFKFRKVTAVFDQTASNGLTALTSLHESLRQVNSEIDHCYGFSSPAQLSEKAIEEELRKLKNKSSRVFVVFQFSLPSVLSLFKKANQMGMVGKGYIWIISDEIASLLDSIDSSFVLKNMQGVIWIKTRFVDTSEAFKNFRNRFRGNYSSRYPGENSNPSIFALRAYDSISAIAQSNASGMMKSLSTAEFLGLSGKIKFRNNGTLAQLPDFDVITVVNKRYEKVAVWSESRGLVGEFELPNALKIAVPESTFEQFVKVSRDPETKKIDVKGFSISVFESVVKRLPYNLPYVFSPYNDTYDEMMQQVNRKEFDAAVGDISILAERLTEVEFTHPYINSGLQMIVVAEPDTKSEQWMFMGAFTRQMWLQLVLMHFFVCSVVWIIEIHHGHNQELEGFGVMLWFSVTTILFLLREPLKSNLARLVLGPWLFVVLVIGASFTAWLSAMLTVSQIKPSISDVETLLRTNATVGCNGKSFVVHYLATALRFPHEKIKNISSVDQYPEEFEKGNIKAAFLLTPHAEVFLAKNCKGFIRADSVHNLAGLGFALQKGSVFTADISKAVVQVITESKEVQDLEEQMLSSFNCSSSITFGSGPIGVKPFSVLFTISGSICAFAALVTLVRLLVANLLTDPSSCFLLKALLKRQGFRRWASIRKLTNKV